MAKTESEIRRDFARMAKASPLGLALKGRVLPEGQRETDAKTEDLVVAFLAGLDGQVQTGIVVFNIYVADKPSGPRGRAVRDYDRISELEALIEEFVSEAGEGEYDLETEATPKARPVEGIGQHVIAAKIKFKRIST